MRWRWRAPPIATARFWTSIATAWKSTRSPIFCSSAASRSRSPPATASTAFRKSIAAGQRYRSRSSATTSRSFSRALLPRRRSRFFLFRLGKDLGEASHERLVGEIDAQRRDRDALVLDRPDVGAARDRPAFALEGDPVIGIAAAVGARLDAHQLLVALALGANGDALHL